jgi:hypothetical protein
MRAPALLLCAALAGCTQQMATQPSYRPLQRSPFFDDERASRPLVAGTVPHRPGQKWHEDLVFETGRRGTAEDWAKAAALIGAGGKAPVVSAALAADSDSFEEAFPWPVDREVLRRGEQHYNVFCAVCHDRAGTGDGMIVRRGFTRPPKFTEPRLLKARPGYFVYVMTRGFGAMPDYAAQVPPQARWEIAAWIRVLQRSQHATLADVPEQEKARLAEKGGPSR